MYAFILSALDDGYNVISCSGSCHFDCHETQVIAKDGLEIIFSFLSICYYYHHNNNIIVVIIINTDSHYVV